jgi:hypothetical protein
VKVGGDIYPDRDRHRVPIGLLVCEQVLSSDKSTFYTVTQLADGSWTCECEGFLYQSRMDGCCRHIDEVREAKYGSRNAVGLL